MADKTDKAEKKPTAITLNPDIASREVSTTRLGKQSNIILRPGKVFPIVPDDSRDEGIGESLAQRLLDDGVVVPVADAETDAKPSVKPVPIAEATGTTP